MLDLGFSELLVVIFLSILILGPDRVKDAVRTIGRYYREIVKYKEMLDREIEEAMRIEEEPRKPKRKKRLKEVRVEVKEIEGEKGEEEGGKREIVEGGDSREDVEEKGVGDE